MDNFKLHEQMRDWLHERNIRYYRINDKNEIDVQEDVYLVGVGLTELPFKFGLVEGYFYCRSNKLTSLKNAPHTVLGDFDASSNNLSDLVGGPVKVTGDYSCLENPLKSPVGSPTEVGGGFVFGGKLLETFEGLPKKIVGNLGFGHINIEILFKEFEKLDQIEVIGKIGIIGCDTNIFPKEYCDHKNRLMIPFDEFKVHLLNGKLNYELNLKQTHQGKRIKI